MSSFSGSDEELGEMEIDGNGSSEFTSDEDEDSIDDDALYRKKYLFVKRIARNIIYVSNMCSECGDFSVAPVDMKLDDVSLLDNFTW